MERFINISTLKEVFRGSENIGSFQEYIDRIYQLHHRYLEVQLTQDNRTAKLTDEMLKFAEDAEFLATQYTNPLVINRNEGLPVEDVPSRQIVQDALALSGTIYEFLGDIVATVEKHGEDFLKFNSTVSDEPCNKNEKPRNSFDEEDKEVEIYSKLGSSKLLYFKSSLCYGLGLYESRTRVILNRITNNFELPKEILFLHNYLEWEHCLVSGLLARNLYRLTQAKDILKDITSNIRQNLKSSKNKFCGKQYENLSSHKIVEIESSLSLIDAVLLSLEAFLSGDSVFLDNAKNKLSRAIECAYQLGDYERVWIVRTIASLITKMWVDSPWVRLEGVITQKAYIKKLVEDGILTLWSSQIAALEMRSKIGQLKGGYLDDRIKKVIINMPTSAGKTLLAELAIAQQAFINKKCIYIGPYRALCDQIASTLSERLSQFGIRVSAIVSDNDISEYEGLLFGQANVLVVTPEKLNYMIRQNHSFVREAEVYIFDEIHNISKLSRGWSYEELITLILKHPYTNQSKMLFLSAIMPNHITIQEWVDPDKTADIICELWQPTRLLKGAIVFPLKVPEKNQMEVVLPGDLIYVRNKGDLNSPLYIKNIIHSKQVLKLETHNGRAIKKRDANQSDGKIENAVSVAERFSRLGPVLVYCPKRVDTTHFCKLALSVDLSFIEWKDKEKQQYFDEVIEFVRERLPVDHILIKALKNRIAFHHAGLPHDVRSEIEYAFRRGWIHILAATSTLVEGVNFPVKTLILADYCQGRRWDSNKSEWSLENRLTDSDFRNIAGRAGRAAYETEGQVIIIQPLAGFPYGYENQYTNYFQVELDSPELNISSSLANDDLLVELNRLVEEVDSGEISEQQLLFEIQKKSNSLKTVEILKKLQAFALLLQEHNLVSNDEETFVSIFQHTFIGKQLPNQAPQAIGAFSFRSAQAIKTFINKSDRSLFAQVGLKIDTCYNLQAKTRQYWSNNHLDEILDKTLDYEILYSIANIIYSFDDNDIAPSEILLASEGKGSRTKRKLSDDNAFFAEWILKHDTEELLSKYFGIIKDSAWRADQFVLYTQQTLGYKAPWTLSAFWIFSKDILLREYNTTLVNTKLGRELLLLPAYAKFGVNSPASALFSTLGVSPSILTRQLGELYDLENSQSRYDYPKILEWLLAIEPLDLENKTTIKSFHIQRLVRTLKSLKPLTESFDIKERVWQINFPIAGWQYYFGNEHLYKLSVGDKLVLRPEPTNKYDPNAIEIYTQNEVKLGYIPRFLSFEITNRRKFRKIQASISGIYPSAPSPKKVFVNCVDVF